MKLLLTLVLLITSASSFAMTCTGKGWTTSIFFPLPSKRHVTVVIEGNHKEMGMITFDVEGEPLVYQGILSLDGTEMKFADAEDGFITLKANLRQKSLNFSMQMLSQKGTPLVNLSKSRLNCQ